MEKQNSNENIENNNINVITTNIAKNITAFRKNAGLTQLELAEKLKYSDKTISKWERGDGVPDIFILKQLADFYGTTVDMLVSDEIKVKKINKAKIKNRERQRLIISLLVIGSIWFCAAVVYTILAIFTTQPESFWLIFIYAIPVSATVLYFCNIMWGNRLLNVIVMSLIAWSTCLSVYLSLPHVPYMWLVFVLAGVFQILMLLWFFFIKTKINFRRKQH